MPTSRRGLLAAVGAGTAALAGCTTVERARERAADLVRDQPERRVPLDWRPGPGTWAGWGYGPGNTNHNPHASPPRSSPVVDWEHAVDGEVSSLVIAEDRVYAAVDGAVLALDAADGTLQWRRETGGVRRLRYVDGRLYEHGHDRLSAVTPEGELLWTVEHSTIIWLFERSGYVFVETLDGYLTVHADTGAIVRQRAAPLREFATDGETVFTRSDDRVFAHDVDGRLLDRRWVTNPENYRTAVGPAIAEDHLYVAELSMAVDSKGLPHRVTRYSTEGTEIDSVALADPADGVAVVNGRLFVGAYRGHDDGGRVQAFGQDGTRRWSVERGGLPMVSDGTVYLRGDDSLLVALDAHSGEELWRREASGGFRHTLAPVAETLYVGGDSIVALR